MRGDSQNINLDVNSVEKFFNSNSYNIVGVNRLVLTGGEPTLNPQSILKIIKEIIDNNIQIKSFVMVINGSNYNQELIDGLNKLYNYKQQYDNRDTFEITCSQDQYHKQPKQDILEKYYQLSYFKSHYQELSYKDIICIGRAYQNNLGMISSYYIYNELLNNYINHNYPNKYDDSQTIFLDKLYLSSKRMFGFYIMDATYDMIDNICIYNQNDLETLLLNKNKVKRRK